MVSADIILYCLSFYVPLNFRQFPVNFNHKLRLSHYTNVSLCMHFLWWVSRKTIEFKESRERWDVLNKLINYDKENIFLPTLYIYTVNHKNCEIVESNLHHVRFYIFEDYVVYLFCSLKLIFLGIRAWFDLGSLLTLLFTIYYYGFTIIL